MYSFIHMYRFEKSLSTSIQLFIIFFIRVSSPLSSEHNKTHQETEHHKKNASWGKITSTSFTSGSGCKESGHNYRKDGQLSGQPIHGVFKNLFSINLFFFVIGFLNVFSPNVLVFHDIYIYADSVCKITDAKL